MEYYLQISTTQQDHYFKVSLGGTEFKWIWDWKNHLGDLQNIKATDEFWRHKIKLLNEMLILLLFWGPLSLVSTTEELLDRKVLAPV
jgi:hypothetical protein